MGEKGGILAKCLDLPALLKMIIAGYSWPKSPRTGIWHQAARLKSNPGPREGRAGQAKASKNI